MYDRDVIIGAALDDLEPEAIKVYREKSKVNENELNYSDKDLLSFLNVLVKYKNDYYVTIEGLILFGNEFALRRYCPLHRVDYILIEGTEWITNTYQTIEIRQPLILAIPKLITLVVNNLYTKCKLNKVILYKIIKELIVNAVMHRDYKEHSPIQIIKYSNRLEIRNPGYALNNINLDSIIRNKTITSVLSKIGFAENKRLGIKIILESMLEYNLSLPTFESNTNLNNFNVILKL